MRPLVSSRCNWADATMNAIPSSWGRASVNEAGLARQPSGRTPAAGSLATVGGLPLRSDSWKLATLACFARSRWSTVPLQYTTYTCCVFPLPPAAVGAPAGDAVFAFSGEHAARSQDKASTPETASRPRGRVAVESEVVSTFRSPIGRAHFLHSLDRRPCLGRLRALAPIPQTPVGRWNPP